MTIPIDDLPLASLHCVNCIVTGEPATVWSGHVVAKSLGGVEGSQFSGYRYSRLHIIAGFKDQATLNAFRQEKEYDGGYFGIWKKAYGIRGALS